MQIAAELMRPPFPICDARTSACSQTKSAFGYRQLWSMCALKATLLLLSVERRTGPARKDKKNAITKLAPSAKMRSPPFVTSEVLSSTCGNINERPLRRCLVPAALRRRTAAVGRNTRQQNKVGGQSCKPIHPTPKGSVGQVVSLSSNRFCSQSSISLSTHPTLLGPSCTRIGNFPAFSRRATCCGE